jgi:hypothetical protein
MCNLFCPAADEYAAEEEAIVPDAEVINSV